MFRSLILTALLAATPAAAFDMSSMTENEREQFRAEVRSYLLDHPEVLMEAIQVLEDRRNAEQAQSDVALIKDHYKAIFEDGVSWVGGNPDGDITIVEFLDYKCGYCKKAQPEVLKLLKDDGQIRYIVKEFPILGEQSVIASRFAISVLRNAGPEAYGKIHDELMAFRGEIGEASLHRLAKDSGLDADKILAGMTDPDVDSVIAANHQLAQALQINGTPGFIFETQLVRGYVPYDQMASLVQSVRTSAD